MAQVVAGEMGALVVEGGLWYRALTYSAIQQNIDLMNTNDIIALLATLQFDVKMAKIGHAQFLINNIDVINYS